MAKEPNIDVNLYGDLNPSNPIIEADKTVFNAGTNTLHPAFEQDKEQKEKKTCISARVNRSGDVLPELPKKQSRSFDEAFVGKEDSEPE